MIRAQTILKVVDNSGGKIAKCIKVKGKSGKAAAHLGDIVIVSIQSLRKRYRSQVRVRVSKSEVHQGVIVQARRFHPHPDGRATRFGRNSVVILNPKGKPLGTRISTVLPRGLRGLKWSKLGTLAKGFV